MDLLKRQPHPHHLQDQVQQDPQNPTVIVIPTTVTAVILASNPIVVTMAVVVLNPILLIQQWQN